MTIVTEPGAGKAKQTVRIIAWRGEQEYDVLLSLGKPVRQRIEQLVGPVDGWIPTGDEF